MPKKLKIKDLFKKIDLPLGKYVIFGSGPMGIRGLRKCYDLDILVTEDIFNEYKNKSDWEYKEFERDGRHVEMVEKNNIELYKTWGPGEWNEDELIKTSEIIDGLPFVRLEYVIKWKKISGREKDLNDIKIIEGYIKSKKQSHS